MSTNLKPTYRRILLKLSGEALMGEEGFGIDPKILDRMAQEIKELIEMGIQVGLVIGGGNLFRGKGLADAGMNRVVGDQMGMLATVMNGLAMRDALHRAFVNTRLMSAIDLAGVCDTYNWAQAISLLKSGRVVIFAAGTGNPFFTTDSAACLRGIEIEADAVFKATKVDGIYSEDPVKNPEAVLYKNLTYDQEPPLSIFHNRVEGNQEYISLLFIPSKAPFDLYDRDKAQGVKLYAKRIFIMEANEKLIPQYLRFMKGVIDSSDLPLNVSREILQDSKALESIRSGTVKKILTALEDMAKKKPDDFKKFWSEFGLVLKEGPAEDFANREKIAGLLRFASTFDESDAQSVSLADYISRMKPEQEVMYYITADSFLGAKNSPHLEIFKKKKIEVLLLGDRVDEWLMSNLPEVSGKKFQSIAKGDLDLGKLEDESEKVAQKDIEEKSKTLVEKIAKSLGDKIKEVKVTHRLTDSPACLVVGENDISGNLERILKAAGQNTPDIKPVLEINPEHALIKKLSAEKDGKAFDEYSSVVFDQALISEGGQLEDPVGFVKRINELLVK